MSNEGLSRIVASTSLTASPIGKIPADFKRLGELCKKAFIRYHDEELVFKDKEGKETERMKYRNWRIVIDQKPAGQQSSTVGHSKYCMLLAYLEHKNPGLARSELLELSLQEHTIERQSCLEMNEQLVREGVPQYESRRVSTKKGKDKNDQFDAWSE